ncbi:MFS transporter [Desulfococcus sp.]|uniref:MFS transporter n=1 Tax=Desulfococcus sp. TaxID=2025834 RepID=UPI003593C850
MPVSFGKRLRIFLPFALGYFLSYLYRAINAVLAPNLSGDMGLSPAELGLLTAVYFISFGAFQLPLGILLDRYGPRRIEAALLIAAAAGALLFARAGSLPVLVIGRALIGFGVSACLMAAFKAFVVWFPPEQLPRINGFQMAAGGMGALAATAPVEAAMAVTDWRGMFTMLSLLTAGVAAVIFFVVPERRPPREAPGRDLRFSEQVRGIGAVFGSTAFWRIAPWAALSQATLMSIQGLWAGPWLRDVGGLDRARAAGVLFWVAVAMVAGFILLGAAAERLNRRGVSPMTLAGAGMGAFMTVLLAIILSGFQDPPGRSGLLFSPGSTGLWILFGFFGTSGILPYAILTQSFPAHLAGRVNTALNLLVFVAAFAAQWGIGAIIQGWEGWAGSTGGPGHGVRGYPAAFGVMLALQMAALLWFGIAGRRGGGTPRDHLC